MIFYPEFTGSKTPTSKFREVLRNISGRLTARKCGIGSTNIQ